MVCSNLKLTLSVGAARDMRVREHNRFLYWPAVLSAFWFALVIRDNDLDVRTISIFAAWFVSAAFSLILCLISLGEREWRRSISTLILPLGLVFTFVNYHSRALDYVRFFSYYAAFTSDIEKRPAIEPRFMVWMLGWNPTYGVLYDETDDITSDHPSEAWKRRAQKERVIRSGYQHIIGHFYFVDFDLSG
jgi:hypothetical protein